MLQLTSPTAASTNDMLTIPLLLGVGQLSTVAIDLPADTPEATVAKVVESCNQALGGPRCQAAGQGVRTTLVAIVRWEGTELRISLHKDSAEGPEVDQRQVAFSAEDAPRDRFIAAGLMVAALTAAQINPEAPEPEPPPPPPTKPPPAPPKLDVPPAPPAPPPELPLHLATNLSAEVGQGLSGEGAKWGGGVRLSWLLHSPRIGVTGKVSYLGAGQPTRMRWTSAAVGLIARLSPWNSPIGVEFSGEGVAERVVAQATRDGESDSDGLWRLGGQLSLLAGLRVPASVEPFVGLQLTLLERGFEVRLEDEPLATEPPLRLTGQLGLTIPLF